MTACLKPFRARFLRKQCLLILCVALGLGLYAPAQDKDSPDVLVLSNGDTLHGKVVKAAGGKVTFHSGPLGDVEVSWSDIRELHTAGKYGVLENNVKLPRKHAVAQIPTGTLAVSGGSITVTGENVPPQPIAVKSAAFVVDQPTLDKEINRRPGFFAAWNGAVTAGATLVAATQDNYSVSGGLGLVRTVPTVPWLDPGNRTIFDALGSYGKITEPGTPTVKSAIFHFDAERDEYFTSRMYGLVNVALDHNFSQDLQLQQIYGGGLGWTVFSTPRHEFDLKGTVQYEKQTFISTSSGNQNLIGSTFGASYLLHTKPFTYTQGLAYIPAWNNLHAYSVNETNTLAFTAYKNFGFSVGTIDSYLNNPPASIPPTKRNSFQFTMGLTYAIKSKY